MFSPRQHVGPIMKPPISAKAIKQHIVNDIQACNTLLKLLDQEEDALKTRDAEALASIIEEKNPPLQHLEKSAQQRAMWANTPNLEEQGTAWKTLLQELANEDLKKDWDTLKALTKQCQQKNEVNGKVLTRQKQVYGRLMELMRGQTKAPNLYTASGAASSSSRSIKVDEA